MRDFGNKRSEGRFGGDRHGGGGSRGGFGRRPFFGGPREMHKAVCSGCGKDCEVPFKPTEGREVFCKECYMKKKDGGDSRPPRRERPKEKSEDVGAEDSEQEDSGQDDSDF